MKKLKPTLIRLIASKSPAFMRDPAVIFRTLGEQKKVFCDEQSCFILINFLHGKGSDTVPTDFSDSGLGVLCTFRGRQVHVYVAGDDSFIEQI